jgi:hypothetical protein
MAVREVAFELECFEWADERLEVAGRWKGMGGRRIARPVLTVDTEGGRRRRLVALPGGQLGAAADGWRAAFAWPGDPAEITGAELEVGGNVVVDLPLPDRRRRRRRRAQADSGGGDDATRAEVGALRAQVERLRGELAARERENMQLRTQIEDTTDEEPATAASEATVEIARIAGAREQELTQELDRLMQERDSARTELTAEIEELRAERARLAGERERLEAESARLANEVDELREAFAEAAAEAETARERHGAEIARLEDELRAERAALARLTATPAGRRDLPPPVTGSARRAVAAPPTEAHTLPATDDEPHPGVAEPGSLPAGLDPPGPILAGSRPATQPGESRIPVWLRGRRERPREERGSVDYGPSGAAFAAAADPVDEEDAAAAPAPGAALRALRERMERLFVPNGHSAAEQEETADDPDVLAVARPRRSAAAARARAGATVAARRSPAELWGLRVLAVLLVAVLLVALVLILAHVA